MKCMFSKLLISFKNFEFKKNKIVSLIPTYV
jgi:hypothetical protein